MNKKNEVSGVSLGDKQKKVLAWAILAPFLVLAAPLLCLFLIAAAVVWAIETLDTGGDDYW